MFGFHELCCTPRKGNFEDQKCNFEKCSRRVFQLQTYEIWDFQPQTFKIMDFSGADSFFSATPLCSFLTAIRNEFLDLANQLVDKHFAGYSKN